MEGSLSKWLSGLPRSDVRVRRLSDQGSNPPISRRRRLSHWLDPVLAVMATLAIAVSLWQLHGTTAGLEIRAVTIGRTPAALHRPVPERPAPVVVIAHGFAGSQQLMQPFAVTFARNGYTALTFDFDGHGGNPEPLAGSITEINGATRTL